MERDAHQPARERARSDHLERLRLLVTLQNQIVELAQRNTRAQQDCARLAREIARQAEVGKTADGWVQTIAGFLHRTLLRARPWRHLPATPAHRDNPQWPRSTTPARPASPSTTPDHGEASARKDTPNDTENKIETAPPAALRSVVRWLR